MIHKTVIAVAASFLLLLVMVSWEGRRGGALPDETRHPVRVIYPSSDVPQAEWDLRKAARYLDQRQAWWMQWDVAARDHGTFCVSCHTSLPYMLARPALRGGLDETGPTLLEQKTLENIRKRVLLGPAAEPYYSDKDYGSHKSEESRATETVLNALLLSAEDSRHGILTKETRAAFAEMWALQSTSGEDMGAWPWQQFGLHPWESHESTYFGASLAALAVGLAPQTYATDPDIQTNLQLLRGFLHRKLAEQPLLNSLVVLWASTKLSGILSTEEQKAIIHDILSKQQSDGGWRLSSLLWYWREGGVPSLLLMWKKADWSFQESQSDGLATGMICYVLQEAGVPSDDPKLAAALAWLEHAQDKSEGHWTGYSLNKKRDPTSNVGRFMSDAATGFAVLALSENKAKGEQHNNQAGH
jgi:squalene-hopene/tetraprenyl-beta-curcumene cyclase